MNLIVVVDSNRAVSRDGGQLCYIPVGLKRFQVLATGRLMILGRRISATFPGGRPLKNRRNLVLSRSPSPAPEGVEVFRPLEALRVAVPADFSVIGGESVYAALLDQCGMAYATRIDRMWGEADAFLPDLDAGSDREMAKEEEPQEHTGIPFRCVTYRRRKSHACR